MPVITCSALRQPVGPDRRRRLGQPGPGVVLVVAQHAGHEADPEADPEDPADPGGDGGGVQRAREPWPEHWCRRGQAWSLHVISLCVQAVRQPLRGKEVAAGRAVAAANVWQAHPVVGLRARAALGCCLAAQAVLLARHYRPVRATPWHNLDIVLATTPLFVAALVLLAHSNLRPRQGAALVVLVGALLQAVALLAPPRTSDDDYRYIWDAKVQLAGIDPYRYAPTAPQLAPLRDPTLFPIGVGAPSPSTAPARGSTGRPSGPSTRRSRRVPSTRSGSRRGVGAGISCPCRSPPPWARSWSPGCCRAGPWHAAGRSGTPRSGPGARSRSRSSATTPTSTGWP